MSAPVTPDGRYILVRGRLWRASDPTLASDRRQSLVDDLMAARRAVGAALRSGDAIARGQARHEVDRIKRSLGERGPVWWDDGAPDQNRRLARTTSYAKWAAEMVAEPPTRAKKIT